MNEHLFYVVNRDHDISPVIKSIESQVAKLAKRLKRSIACQYQFNQVTNRDGKNLGYGYLWISNPEVFRALTGLNLDGSKRQAINYQTDPTVLAKQLEQALAEFMAKDDPSQSWADIQDEEDQLRAQYQPVEIISPLPPLIDLKAISPDWLYISPYTPKPNHPNSLFCSSIPDWANATMIEREFQPFSKSVKVTIGGQPGKYHCLVTFRRPIDAEIALAMKAKITLVQPRTKQKKLILFRMDAN